MNRHGRRAAAAQSRGSGLILPHQYDRPIVPVTAARPAAAPPAPNPPIGEFNRFPEGVRDADGNPVVLQVGPNPDSPAAIGMGFLVFWQDGPVDVAGRNGAFVEDLLIACRERLESFQAGDQPSEHNGRAMRAIDDALEALHDRHAERAEPEGPRLAESADAS